MKEGDIVYNVYSKIQYKIMSIEGIWATCVMVNNANVTTKMKLANLISVLPTTESNKNIKVDDVVSFIATGEVFVVIQIMEHYSEWIKMADIMNAKREKWCRRCEIELIEVGEPKVEKKVDPTKPITVPKDKEPLCLPQPKP